MLSIDHRVRVFVFQILNSGIQYLLLRQKPTQEWPFGPVVGTVRPEEHLKDAVLREVEEGTGLDRPVHLMDLVVPQKELFGDIGLVEWPYAFQAAAPSSPAPEVRPGPTIGDFAWMTFEQAFERVGTSLDRDSLVRLQISLKS